MMVSRMPLFRRHSPPAARRTRKLRMMALPTPMALPAMVVLPKLTTSPMPVASQMSLLRLRCYSSDALRRRANKEVVHAGLANAAPRQYSIPRCQS